MFLWHWNDSCRFPKIFAFSELAIEISCVLRGAVDEVPQPAGLVYVAGHSYTLPLSDEMPEIISDPPISDLSPVWRLTDLYRKSTSRSRVSYQGYYTSNSPVRYT